MGYIEMEDNDKEFFRQMKSHRHYYLFPYIFKEHTILFPQKNCFYLW